MGTHYYHSHSGLQRIDGMYGAIVVREAEDIHSALYDHDLADHVLLVQDWMHKLASSEYTAVHHSDGGVLPPSALINGKLL